VRGKVLGGWQKHSCNAMGRRPWVYEPHPCACACGHILGTQRNARHVVVFRSEEVLSLCSVCSVVCMRGDDLEL
jgi:hypothetical protein